jgi:hypothetical protein
LSVTYLIGLPTTLSGWAIRIDIIAVIAVVVVTIRLERRLLTEVLLARVTRLTDDRETGLARVNPASDR